MMPRVELVDRARARNHPPATRLSRLRDSLEKLAVGLVLGKHLSDRANRILAATQREGAIPEVRRKPIVPAFLGPRERSRLRGAGDVTSTVFAPSGGRGSRGDLLGNATAPAA